jgi:hypothetical protein
MYEEAETSARQAQARALGRKEIKESLLGARARGSERIASALSSASPTKRLRGAGNSWRWRFGILSSGRTAPARR